MEWLAERLATIRGVVAVTLRGSRAQGTERADSDWDFGLYYRDLIGLPDHMS
jgi:predicted nucleotidyltransferase